MKNLTVPRNFRNGYCLLVTINKQIHKNLHYEQFRL